MPYAESSNPSFSILFPLKQSYMSHEEFSSTYLTILEDRCNAFFLIYIFIQQVITEALNMVPMTQQ